MKAWSRYMRRDRIGGGGIGGARFFEKQICCLTKGTTF